jgi:hypothetical protein
MDSRKETMVSALLKKAQALKASTDLQDALSTSSGDSPSSKPFEDFLASWITYAKWAEHAGSPEKDAKMLALHIWKEKRRGALGSALKSVNKYLDETPAGDCTRASKGATVKAMSDVRIELVREMFGTDCVWIENEKAQQVMRYPKELAPF